MPYKSTNRSLFDELNSESPYPTTFSFESSSDRSSEFIKFENMKMLSESEENKSDESLEKKFLNDEMGFKNNVTNEEHRTLDEAVFDGQSVKYSSVKMKIINGTKDDEKAKATAVPTTVKKGKYLDLLPQENENINASIPNNAEVWALAGMRGFDAKPTESNEANADLGQISAGMNNTAKNLLDWTEIAKMNNETDSGDEGPNDLSVTTVVNDIKGIDDPATSENKQSGSFIATQSPSTTMSTIMKVLTKTIVDDNRIEQDNGNIEFGGSNKTLEPTSRIDSDAFAKKNPEEREDTAVELIDPSMKIDNTKTHEKLRVEELEVFATTESSEVFTTVAAEVMETTTTEAYETTTSIVDSFTVIGEDDENEDVFKRTVTEGSMVTTPQPVETTSTTQSTPKTTSITQTTSTIPTTTVPETSTNIPSSSINEIPKSTQRYFKSTKSLRILTTTEPPVEPESTVAIIEDLPSTMTPKYKSSSQTATTTPQYEFESFSSSSPAVEITDDDKFKYSTLLPEMTTNRLRAKSVDLEESSTKLEETLNQESLDGEPMSNGNLGIITVSVSIAVILILAGAVYVSSASHCQWNL